MEDNRAVEQMEEDMEMFLEKKLSIEAQLSIEREIRENGGKDFDDDYYEWTRRAKVALRRTLIEYRQIRRLLARKYVKNKATILGIEPNNPVSLLAHCLVELKSPSRTETREALMKAVELYLRVTAN